MSAFRKWLAFVFQPWLPARSLKLIQEQSALIDDLKAAIQAGKAREADMNATVVKMQSSIWEEREAKEKAQKLAAKYQDRVMQIFEGMHRFDGLPSRILYRVEADLPNMRVFVASISAEARVDREAYLDVPVITLISKLRVGAINAPPELWAGQVAAEMKQAVLIAFQDQSILNLEAP